MLTLRKVVSKVLICIDIMYKNVIAYPFVFYESLNVDILFIFRRRQKTHVPMLQVWTADKPHPQEEVN